MDTSYNRWKPAFCHFFNVELQSLTPCISYIGGKIKSSVHFNKCQTIIIIVNVNIFLILFYNFSECESCNCKPKFSVLSNSN